MSYGPPPGSPLGGPTGSGLPFAGVPPELAERADEILAREPAHELPPVEFAHWRDDPTPFSLRTFLAPHRAALAGALGLVAAETVTLLAGPLLVQVGVDRGITAGDLRVVLVVAGIYLAVIAANVLLGRVRGGYTVQVGERLMEQLRLRVFGHLERLSLDFFEREKAGVIMTRMTSDVENLSALFQEGLVQIAVQGMTVVVIAVLMLLLDLRLGLVVLLTVVPVLVATSVWYRRASIRGYDEVRDRISDLLADLQEGLAGVRTVTAFGRAGRNVAHHDELAEGYYRANLRTARQGAVFGAVGETLGILGQVVILGIGGLMVRNGDLSLGRLFSFLLYLGLLFAPVQQLVQLYTTYQQGRSSVSKLAELLATRPSVVEAPDASPLPPITGRIELRDVHFAYRVAVDPETGTAEGPLADGPGDATAWGPEVLGGLDLEVRAGETLAVVGPTGAGKSTVAKLVARCYDPTAGEVLIDGHDLRTVTIPSLRRQLGVVPQEAFLFQGTVRDNLAFARPGAGDDEIMAACRAVGIDDLVERMPDGLDTPVHERGVSLSAGERQLLGLGRAFLARPRVLVLDEATSNLDPAAERRVERAMDALLEGRTAILVVHRLATARRADRIAVVDRGDDGSPATVRELGTHDELVSLGGRYAAMYATWERHLTDEERAAS
ncbi:MAG: ABC transporter ATP-binding protein [Microthrixaceae bacterium]